MGCPVALEALNLEGSICRITDWIEKAVGAHDSIQPNECHLRKVNWDTLEDCGVEVVAGSGLPVPCCASIAGAKSTNIRGGRAQGNG